MDAISQIQTMGDCTTNCLDASTKTAQSKAEREREEKRTHGFKDILTNHSSLDPNLTF